MVINRDGYFIVNREGFEYGAVSARRLSDNDEGNLWLGLETPKDSFYILVTPSDLFHFVNEKGGCCWKPEKEVPE